MIKFLNLKVAAAILALLLAGCDGWKHHLSSDGTLACLQVRSLQAHAKD